MEKLKIQLQSGIKWSKIEDHVIEEIFYLLLRQSQKRDKKLKVQLFLAYFLVPLVLVGQSCFCLVLEIGFSVGLAINGAESISGMVAIGFFGYSL